MKSLFDESIPDLPPKKVRGKFATWKKENHYRKTKGEQRCANCLNFMKVGYFKCRLMGATNSAATDIRASYVCDQWNPRHA